MDMAERPVGGASDRCELDDGDSPGCSGPERSVAPCPDICAYNLTNKMNGAEMQSDSMHYIMNRI